MHTGEQSYSRFLSGDKKGLEEIIVEYSDELVLYINQIVGNIDLSKDIMTETFVKLYVKKPEYSEKSSFKTWLFSIARFTAYDYIKKNKGISLLSEEELNSFPDEESIERKVIQNEEKINLHRAIKKLKPEYSQIIYLIYFEGLDTAETAKVIKKTKKQTGELLYRAKLSLKKILEKEGISDYDIL